MMHLSTIMYNYIDLYLFVCLSLFPFSVQNSHLGSCEPSNLPDIGGKTVVGVLGQAHGVRDPVDPEVDRIHRSSHRA